MALVGHTRLRTHGGTHMTARDRDGALLPYDAGEGMFQSALFLSSSGPKGK